MSSTMYQTNAKPRGRRGSQGETLEKPARSRASSSASLRLSKTLSRALDEVSVPRNSRPNSPAIYLQRNRTMETRSLDQEMSSIGQNLGSRTRQRQASVVDPVDPQGDQTIPPMPSTSTAQPSIPPKEDVSARRTSSNVNVDTAASESSKSSSTLSRNSRSSRSLASMQPTVTEETDENPGQMSLPVRQPSVPLVPLIRKRSSVASEPSASEIPLPTSPIPDQRSQMMSTNQDPRASESSIDELVLAPAPKAAIPFIQPIRPGSPATSYVESGVSVPVAPMPRSVSRTNTIHEQGLLASTPVASPPQSPFMHQYLHSPHLQPSQSPIIHHYLGSPPLQAVPYPPPFPYPPPLMGGPVFDPNVYAPGFGPPTFPNMYPEFMPRPGSVEVDDERTKLLEKVSNVLPDLNRLLLHYQETKGLLSEKDNLVKQAESLHTEEISKLRVELAITKEEYEKLIGEQVSENVKLKAVVAEQAEKIVALSSQANNVDPAQARSISVEGGAGDREVQPEAHKGSVKETDMEEEGPESELGILKRQLATEATNHERMVADLKTNCERKLAEREEMHSSLIAEHKAALARLQLDLAAMITKHSWQKKELDASRTQVSELENELLAKDDVLNEASQNHQEELGASRKVIEDLTTRHNQEIALWSEKMAKSIVRREEMINDIKTSFDSRLEQEKTAREAQISAMTEDNDKRRSQLQAELETARRQNSSLENALAAERARREALQKTHALKEEEYNGLKAKHDKALGHHVALSQAMMSFKTKQSEWQRESDKMAQLLQAFGQVDTKES